MKRFAVGIGIVIAGISLVFLALTLNNITSNYSLWGGSSQIMIANIGFSAVFLLGLVWGITTVIFRQRRQILFANLSVLMCIAVTPLLGEIVIRLGIAFGPDFFRQPNIYANPFSDPDNQKLTALWRTREPQQRSTRFPNLEYDKELGWVFPNNPENPLGVVAELPYEIHPEKQPVLFFGDSFVGYGEPMQNKIPQLMDRMLPNYQVFNYGVGGYGIDQVLLHFQRSHPLFEKPIILFGLLTVDMDRCLLDYFYAPKPYFEIEANALVLKGVPVVPSDEQYLRAHPVSINSYFLAASARSLHYILGGGNSMQHESRRGQKEAISTKILEAAVRTAREKDLNITFVLFSPASGGGWRREFLLSEFERLDTPYIDIEQILVTAERRTARKRKQSFDTTGHHSTWANQVIAKAIAGYLQNMENEDPS
jgi:hypothetical protein